ncbi:MAG: hypothetical protein M1829_006539 [Trizodia sp. TS-e1964]|nr:MAG: hypothetical protein M1829_006539 [Trizodia sp. TS-e1964]
MLEVVVGAAGDVLPSGMVATVIAARAVTVTEFVEVDVVKVVEEIVDGRDAEPEEEDWEAIEGLVEVTGKDVGDKEAVVDGRSREVEEEEEEEEETGNVEEDERGELAVEEDDAGGGAVLEVEGGGVLAEAGAEVLNVLGVLDEGGILDEDGAVVLDVLGVLDERGILDEDGAGTLNVPDAIEVDDGGTLIGRVDESVNVLLLIALDEEVSVIGGNGTDPIEATVDVDEAVVVMETISIEVEVETSVLMLEEVLLDGIELLLLLLLLVVLIMLLLLVVVLILMLLLVVGVGVGVGVSET